MTDWVTDPDALRTIVLLNELRIGDEIKERRRGDGVEFLDRIDNEDERHVFQGYYASQFDSGAFQLVGWRRPCG